MSQHVNEMVRHTAVCILGAGPAGLTLANILRQHGIDSLVVETHSREHLRERGRAGLIESTTVALLARHGLADTILQHGTPHDRCEFRFPDRSLVFEYGRLAGGESHHVYPQNQLVDDLAEHHLAAGGIILYQCPARRIDNRPDAVTIECHDQIANQTVTIHADFVAGCDGFLGLARTAMPAASVQVYHKEYAYAWLAVLAHAPPSTEHIIYALHPDGFAGHMLRSKTISRYYLQVPRDEDLGAWPDERIWAELHKRLAKPGWALQEGPIFEKSIVAMRSYVMEPMQHGRLFLAGDAAHIVSPCGAKGMNLAIQDAGVLADTLIAYHRDGRDLAVCDRYSALRLPMVWRGLELSHTMLQMLHGPEGTDPESLAFLRKLEESRLAQLVTSETFARHFARCYVGIV